MKKSYLLFLSLGIVGMMAMESCNREGCMDETANNYDEDAKEDDGSCKYDGCTDATAINYDEMATDNDGTCMTFSSFTTNFTLEASITTHNPTSTAHMISDSTSTRDIYFLNGQDASGGAYPVGTMIAKHSYNGAGDAHEYTAMVKQESGFNSSAGDWEWFVLNADGTVATDGDGNEMRGANLFDGMCLNCHAFASTDYVFSK